MPTTRYIWHRDAVRMETDGTEATTASYARQPDQFGSLISQKRDGQVSTHHYDALGSTSELTNSSQAVSDTFRYSAFGKEVERTGSTETPYVWVGKSGYQKETAHASYVRRRFYSSSTGRWVSQDPIGPFWDASPYSYVSNGPLTSFDPTGLVKRCFTAGIDLTRPQCRARGLGGSHLVCYEDPAEVNWCAASLLAKAAAGSVPLPCAAALLFQFLRFPPLKPFCPVACKTALLASSWFDAAARDALFRAFPDNWKCGSTGTLKKTTVHHGGPCSDPFGEFSVFDLVGSVINKDLANAIGAIDQATVTVNGLWGCKLTSTSTCCCDCAAIGNVDLSLTDRYDFVSTLPKTAKKGGAFWCAAVLEASKRGHTFQTDCSVSGRRGYTKEMCPQVPV